MFQLTKQEDKRRTYTSTVTGTDVTTKLIYTDKNGMDWWTFEDLLNIPFIRKKAAEKASDLYGRGFTNDDLKAFIEMQKITLKGSDSDKYERAYSEILQLEKIVETTIDPIKESLSLCTIYILGNEERIDTFSFRDAEEKISSWALDLDSQAFFLTYFLDGIVNYTKCLKDISQIASIVHQLQVNPAESLPTLEDLK